MRSRRRGEGEEGRGERQTVTAAGKCLNTGKVVEELNGI